MPQARECDFRGHIGERRQEHKVPFFVYGEVEAFEVAAGVGNHCLHGKGAVCALDVPVLGGDGKTELGDACVDEVLISDG